MEQNHTPEPWHIETGDGTMGEMQAVLSLNGNIVCDNEPYYPTAVHPDDQARIVACVNACKGISNEELARVTDLAGLVNHYEAMKAEHDEALVLLREAEERLAKYEG